jgi:hypothetical protein
MPFVKELWLETLEALWKPLRWDFPGCGYRDTDVGFKRKILRVRTDFKSDC